MRILERLDLAVGIAAGQQLVQGDAGGVQVAAAARLAAGKTLRRHVAGGAGAGAVVLRRQPGAVGDAEIEQPQLAVAAQVHIVRLDVAVHDAEAVQRRHRAAQREADGDHLADAETLLRQPCGQRFAVVPALQVVQVLAFDAGGNLGKIRRTDALLQPLLHQQRLLRARIAGQQRRQRLQHPVAAGSVGDAIGQPAGRSVQADDHRQPLERLAVAQLRRQRQAGAARQLVGQRALRQRLHPQHQRRQVVLRAGGQRRFAQHAGGALHVEVQVQDLVDALVTQRLPHAVAQQREHVAGVQVAVAEIRHHVLVQPHAALEHVRQRRFLPHVIDGQLRQPPLTEPVDAAVADVGDGVAVAAQHQRRQRRHQRLALRAQPAVVRRQQPVQRRRHCPRFRRGVVVGAHRADGGLRRQAAVGTAGDAIGQREQRALAGQEPVLRHAPAQCVLVAFTAAGVAGVADGKLQAHGASLLEIMPA